MARHGSVSGWRQLLVLVVMSVTGWQALLAAEAAKTSTDKAAATTTEAPATSTDTANAPASTTTTSAVSEAARRYAGIKAELVDFSEVSYDEAPALSLSFSTPLDSTKPFSRQLKVFTADKKKRIDSEWVLSKSGLTAYFTAIEPSNSYVVEVDKALPFANSNTSLTENISREITTKALPPSLAFSGRGSVLPVDLSVGLPVTTVNIKEANVDFFRVNPDKLAEFFTRWPNRSNQYAYSLNQDLEIMSLVYSARFKLDPPKNKRQLTNLPVGDITALKNNPGVYVAIMQQAGHYGDYRLPITWFVISDIGLHARVYRDEIQVLTHSIAKAEPLEKVQLSLLDQAGKTLAQGQTNADGSANFGNYPKAAKVLLAKRNGQTAILNLSAPALDLTAFDLPGKRDQKPLHSFTYSARELYRPGESVTFSTLLRNEDALMAGTPALTARIFRPDGQQVRQYTLHGNALAYYQQEYSIPLDAPTGEWRFQVLAGEQALDEYRFKVEEFLPERMKLTLGDGLEGQHLVSASDTLQVAVDGQYLYGAPAANNRLVSKVVVNPLRQPFDHFKDFEFGQVDEENTKQQFDLPDVNLDAQGKASLDVPNQWSGVKSPLDVNVIANLEESGGRPVTRQIHYTVWPNKSGVIGIRLLGDQKQIQYDSSVQFEIIKVNEKGERVAAKGLQVQLIRHRRDYYWSWDSDWNSSYTEKQYQVYSTSVDVKKDGSSEVEVPVEWGPYRLVVTDQENDTVSSFKFDAGYGWYEQKDAVLAARPDEVKLLLDKPAYKAGDTIHLKLHPPHAGEAVVMVEGDKLLWQKRLKVSTEGATIDIPVKPEWQQHNLYVSALVLRPGDVPNKVTPKRAVGVVHLALDRSDRKLDVAVELPTDKVRPETDVIATIKVKGINSGKTAMVTLAAVDVGVLNITDYVTPDPFRWFFEPRRYAVDLRDIYSQIIDNLQGKAAQRKFGGSNDTGGGKLPPNMVKIVSLFQQPVEVDANGEAQIPLHLPDFNGKLRLMAVAFSEQQFGAADNELTVVAPMVAELSMPRFLAAGDKAEVALDLHNLSGSKQTFDIELKASSPLKVANAKSILVLNDGQRSTLRFPVETELALGAGSISLDIHNQPEAGKEALNIHREWGLGVRPAYPAVVKSQLSVLNKGDTFSLPTLAANLLPASVSISLTASSLPPINVAEQIHELLTYPYGCLEQTTSSTYPWLYATPDVMKKLKLSDKDMIYGSKLDIRLRAEMLDRGISRLASFQLPSGAFGYWGAGGEESTWTSAYATDFLLDAREMNVPVDNAMLDKALNRLLQYVNQQGPINENYWTQDNAHWQLSYQAYAAYVLSRVNRAPLGALRTLYDQHGKDAKRPLPLMHLGVALLNQGDKQRGMAAIDQAIALQGDPRQYWYYGDYGSATRDYAIMTYLAEKAQLPNDKRATLISKLANALPQTSYMSTQERLSLVRAASVLTDDDGSEWTADLVKASGKTELKQKGSFKEAVDVATANAKLQLTNTSDPRLYVQSSIRGYTMDAPAEEQNGLHIERTYLDSTGKEMKLEKVKSGELVVVKLKLWADRRIPDALVVDLLPAGFELENQNLLHSIKMDGLNQPQQQNQQEVPYYEERQQEYEEQRNQQAIQYQEYRDDRYVAAIDVTEDYYYRVGEVKYLMRAVTPGTYHVPNAYVESMYRPDVHAIGKPQASVTVFSRDQLAP